MHRLRPAISTTAGAAPVSPDELRERRSRLRRGDRVRRDVVAAGSQDGGSTDNIVLAKYLWKNGALDGSFGKKGKVTASFNSNSNETARGVISRPASNGGQINVAGWTDASGGR